MIEHKQEIEKAINEIQVKTDSPVGIFTSNESHVKLLTEWFPDIRVTLVPNDFLPDSDKCYIIPVEFNPLKLITLFEEEI